MQCVTIDKNNVAKTLYLIFVHLLHNTVLYGISKIGSKEIDTEYAFNYIKEKYSLNEDEIRELERRFIKHLKESKNPEKVDLTKLMFILVDNEENLKLNKKYKIANNEIKLQEMFNKIGAKYDENHSI